MKRILIITLSIIFYQTAVAQISINSDGASPDGSAMLDVTSTAKGILIPRMTTSERTAISSPATGLLVYDTDENTFWYYEGSDWIEITNNQYENVTQSPSVINSLNVANEPCDMEKSGDYLYIVDKGANKLKAYDISNPEAPTLASSISLSSGSPNAIAINGNYAYIVGSSLATNEFKVVDISDPNNISLIGEYDIGTNLNTIGVNGNYAYAADVHNDKLSVIDISTPSSSSLLTDFTFDMDSDDDAVILLDGNYLYLNYGNENNDSELSIFDISTPAAPSVVSTLSVSSEGGEQLIKKGDYLYFGDGVGIDIIDVSNPAAPSKLSSFSNETQFFTTSENYLFADYTFGSSTMEVYDISSTTSPSLLYSITKNTNSSAKDMMVIDGYLYSLEINGTLDIYQVTYTAVNALGMDGTTMAYPLYDDLGNHIATENIQIDTFWLSNDGDDEGISITDDGNTTLSGTLTIGNTYTLPASDGTVAQVLATDGSGNVDWTDITTSSDDQTIDVFSLSGNDLQLSLEHDGQSTQTVDLSSFLDNTDNQTIDIFSLSGNDLQLSLEDDNASNLTVDLSAITPLTLADTDSDTKIQVEESSDEDIIRFDLGGTEYLRLKSGRIEPQNLGNSIFIGEDAGKVDDLSDNDNIYIGYEAGKKNTTGWANTYFGYQAGLSNITGNRNLYLGYLAGAANTGSGNVFIGYLAGATETGSDKLYIDNSSSSSPLIYGDFDTDKLRINGTLDINNEYEFPTTDGSSNQVLATNGSGTLSWSDINQDLGNHTATQNLELNDNWLSNDGGNEGIQIDDDGNVGIGTTPTNGKFEVLGTGDALASYTYGYLNNSGTTGLWTNAPAYSIYADNKIGGFSFHAHSDERIKNIQGISNSKNDLNTLMNIEITNYTMKDSITNGNEVTKKVIAQQVKSVYPQAVSTNTTQVIPDIYQTATIDKNGWVFFNSEASGQVGQLTMDNGQLQIGEKIQIIFKDKKEILEVLEIKENAFRVPITNHQSPITAFIYGRQVDDFHTVDYEAISMLNVSATQQLAKENRDLKQQVQQQQVEINQLKTKVEKIRELEAKLEAFINQ